MAGPQSCLRGTLLLTALMFVLPGYRGEKQSQSGLIVTHSLPLSAGRGMSDQARTITQPILHR